MLQMQSFITKMINVALQANFLMDQLVISYLLGTTIPGLKGAKVLLL